MRVAESGRIIGRKDSECAHTGVTRIAGTDGYTIEPPAEREYAVDPLGLEKIIPSPCSVVK